ncbi:MAG: trypsin-like peptidase domain-containing protein [Bacteroidales bacterium]|jgi:Do/DeqQ family serine protease|nr:trypsin-like peptidase domain-containing protein [Bacteroidales bacterium]
MKKLSLICPLVVGFLLVIGLTSCAQPSTNQQPTHYVDFTKAAEESVHAVVHIKTEFMQKNSGWDDFFGGSFWGNFFGNRGRSTEYPVVAAGSGVIISEDGYIVTNNHVVEDAEKITVTLNDKREFIGTIVGTDPQADLAVVKIDAAGLPFLQFANSNAVKLGEWVLAVGNPFNLTSTVTAGIVSAKARNLDIMGDKNNISSYIQTDAAVNQGNSGGALVNTEGQLIGINTAIASRNGYFTGYSFAIPSNIVKKVVGDLKQFGRVQYAYLGVQVSEIDSKKAEELNLPKVEGLYVAKSIVDEVGMKQNEFETGDVILSIDNQPVNSLPELREIMDQHSPGEKVKIIYLHNNKEATSYVILVNSLGKTDLLSKEDRDISVLFNAKFRDLTDKECTRFRVAGGVVVEKIAEGALKYAGIKDGFIVTRINGKSIKETSDVDKILQDYNKKFVAFEGFYKEGYFIYTYTIQLPE